EPQLQTGAHGLIGQSENRETVPGNPLGEAIDVIQKLWPLIRVVHDDVEIWLDDQRVPMRRNLATIGEWSGPVQLEDLGSEPADREHVFAVGPRLTLHQSQPAQRTVEDRSDESALDQIPI